KVTPAYNSAGLEQFGDGSSHDTYEIRRASVVAGPAPVSYMPFIAPRINPRDRWHTPGGGLAGTVNWRKDPFGFVWLAGTIGNGLLSFALPPGYRPASTVTFLSHCIDFASGGSQVSITIDTAGVVSSS